MKKAVMIFLSAALALSLAACGNGAQTPSSPAGTDSPAPSSAGTGSPAPSSAPVDIPQGTKVVLSDGGVTVDGSTGEGDGIDSNGWLVINGGTVRAYACSFSGDAGVDSDMGILLNGGTVVATGNMLDAIDGASAQRYVVFSLRDGGGTEYALKDAGGGDLMAVPTANGFSVLLVSCPQLPEGLCALYEGGTLVSSAEPGAGSQGGPGFPGGMGGPGGQRPDGEWPDGGRPQRPDGETPPELPEGGMPEGDRPPEGGFGPGGGQQPPETSEPPAEGSGSV